MSLTALQERFVAELLLAPTDLSEAYARACKALKRPPPKGLKQVASITAKKPDVVAELARRRASQAKRLEIKADDILAELKAMRDVDVADVAPWDADGAHLIPSEKLPKPTRLMIKKIKIIEHTWTTENGSEHKEVRTELEMHDTIRIRELIGRHQGLWDGDGSPRGDTYNILVQQLKLDLATKSTDELRALAEKIASLQRKAS